MICNIPAYNYDDWKTINGQHVNIGKNGELISGNPKVMGKGKRGNPKATGKEKDSNKEKNKSSKKEPKALKETAENGNIASAKGANEFSVKKFVNKQKLNNHWENGRTHKNEYIPDGITTKEQYEKRAVELIQMPCGGNIYGYKTKDGKLCRYDAEKNDYVAGRPDKGIYTMFKPELKEEYFKIMLNQEGVIDDNE